MKFLKKFNETNINIESNIPMDSIYYNNTVNQPKIKMNKNMIYNSNWEVELPKFISIIDNNKILKFKKGNVMLIADTVQITYDMYPGEKWGLPDTLEFDIYFVEDDKSKKIRINVDITYGDFMACEFSINPPNKIDIIEHTTYCSKFDPSNTEFSLTDESLDEFIKFLNKINDIQVTKDDMKFLSQYYNKTTKKA
jgi:hypothetical protein